MNLLNFISYKSKDDEEEWRASGCSSDSEAKKPKKHSAKWRGSDTSGVDQDSDSEEPLFDHYEPEPDCKYCSFYEKASPAAWVFISGYINKALWGDTAHED